MKKKRNLVKKMIKVKKMKKKKNEKNDSGQPVLRQKNLMFNDFFFLKKKEFCQPCKH